MDEPAVAVAAFELRHLGNRLLPSVEAVEVVGGLNLVAHIPALERSGICRVVRGCAKGHGVLAETGE